MTPKSVLRRVVTAAVVVSGLLSMCDMAIADESHHEGMFVGVRAGQIVIVDRYRIATHVYPLTNFVKVTRNGREAALSDLQRGDSVQIMTETRFRMEYVTSVEAVGDDAPG
ncbi:MAG: hypothetical protein JWP89_5330 [Schlesneria sp.]|nr:hypothetical protein [Schlesneria sp.]